MGNETETSIAVDFTQEEIELIKSRSDELGIDISQYVRSAIFCDNASDHKTSESAVVFVEA